MSCIAKQTWAEKWDVREKPCQLSRKFHFSNYRATSAFLDHVNQLVDQLNAHPHTINFGTTYVSIIIDGTQEDGGIAPEFVELARQVSAYADEHDAVVEVSR